MRATQTELLLWVIALASLCGAKIDNSKTQDQNVEQGTPKPEADKTSILAEKAWYAMEYKNHDPEIIKKLPAKFDAREKWPHCPSLNDIYDQGACGSCWAVSSVTAITDRYCIASNGTKQFQASAEDVLSCSEGGTCKTGGFPWLTYYYWETKGIVSGGKYNSKSGCQPYTIAPCNIHDKGHPCPVKDFGDTPQCKKECIKEYSGSYKDDLHFASEIYKLKEDENIKAEIYLNGPVSGEMMVYEDFTTYTGGVYTHRKGPYMYMHVVKLMGWGEEDGLKYWLATSSWNVEWGEKGLCKIAMGQDRSGIVEYVIAGLPDLKR